MWLGLQALAHCIDQETASNAERFPPIEVSYSTAACGSGDPSNATGPSSPSISPLVVSGQELKSLQLTFDEVLNRMKETGQIYIEGDGSFVWCGREICDSKNKCTLWLGKDGKNAEILATPGWNANQEPVNLNDENDIELHSIIWRIEGNLYDGGTNLAYVQFVGAAPVNIWNSFLSLLLPEVEGSKQQPMVFQLEQLGIILDTSEVLKVAA